MIEGGAIYKNMPSAFYNNMKAFEMIEDHQNEHGFVYDIVIKYRADILPDDVMDILDVEAGYLYIPEGRDWVMDSRYGALNDLIAYGDTEVMKVYSSLYRYLEEYLVNEHVIFHPESLLYYHLQKNNMLDRIKRFPFHFCLNENRLVQ